MTTPSWEQSDLVPAAIDDIDSLMRDYRKRSRGRLPIVFAVLLGCIAVNFSVLCLLREIFRPETPPGGWVIDPSFVSRIFAAGYGAAFSIMIPMPIIARRWRRRDISQGLFVPPKVKFTLVQRIAATLLIGLFVIIVPISALISCCGFIVISSDSARFMVRFTNRTYDLQRLKAIEIVPEGYRIEKFAKDGPFARLRFDDGAEQEFGEVNGLTDSEVQVIASHLADHSGVKVVLHPDASRPRKAP